MNKLRDIIICIVFLIPVSSQAQDKEVVLSTEALAQLKLSEDTLGILGYAVVNDSLPENRFASCRAMIPALVRALKTPNSFHYPFARLQSVSIQYPQDSSFRIFTWQLYVDKDEYHYYGAIQMNTPELKLFPLIDRSSAVQNVEQAVLTPDSWYGSVYYNLKECKGPQGKYYLLFGFDGFEFFRKRKIVDVLTFKDGKPVFGAPVFVSQEKGKASIVKKRLMIQYSAESSVRLNYDEALDLLIYDHLIPLEGSNGEGASMVPDGSYEGYKYEKGFWNYISMVFTQVQDEPPRPYPILDERSKDLFGKKGKN